MDNHGGNIYKIAKQYNINRDEIIDFSSNINPLGMPASLKEKISAGLDMLQHYPDPDYTDLRESLADYHSLNIENIITGNGATELIYLFTKALKPGKALIVSPTFSEYHIALAGSGSKIDYFQLKEEDDFKIDIEALKMRLNNDYDLLIICNPNNPTGTFTETAALLKILEQSAANNIAVMIDESFIEFIENSGERSSIKFGKNFPDLFILRSLTKFYAIPGLRLGYSICFNKELASTMRKKQEPWSVNVLADLAGITLPDDTDYRNKTIEIISEEKEFLYRELKKIGWLKIFKGQANFLLAKILNGMPAAELRSRLIKNKILIRDASNFKFLDSKFIRLAIRDRESNKLLVKHLNEIVE